MAHIIFEETGNLKVEVNSDNGTGNNCLEDKRAVEKIRERLQNELKQAKLENTFAIEYLERRIKQADDLIKLIDSKLNV